MKKGLTCCSLVSLIEKSETRWIDPEWGFPKGRRNNGENDIQCAIREYTEETGHNEKDFTIIQNVLPYEEIFTGSNIKSYKHKYYLAEVEDNTICNSNFQKSEVSKIKWCTYDEVIELLRPYSLEKIKIIGNINVSLKKLKLYKFK